MAPSFGAGLAQLLQDETTEAGHRINALKRFNIFPEVVLGGLFRLFSALSERMGWRTEVCYQVNRGDALPPVSSCEGVGNLHFFYVYAVFGVAGSVLGAVFLLGVLLR